MTDAGGTRRPLIGIAGALGAGKDTVAQVLVERFGYRLWGFSEVLKRDMYECHMHRFFPSLEAWLQYVEWEKRQPQSWTRPFMQLWGTESVRQFQPSFWVEKAREWGCLQEGLVIPSVRFPNEGDAIREAGGQLWRVTRPGTAPAPDAHISERALDGYACDLNIVNDSDLPGLRERVELLAGMILGGPIRTTVLSGGGRA